MMKIKLLIAKIRIKFVKYYIIFGRECYMKNLCKVHTSRGIKFDGIPQYIASDVELDNSAPLYIGGGTTIAAKSIILTHDYSITYGLRAVYPDNRDEIAVRKGVSIGKDVFIGQAVIVLPGVTIGDNCIIGAGSLVNRDVPPNTVYGGVPAKYIRSVKEFYEKNMNKNREYIW